MIALLIGGSFYLAVIIAVLLGTLLINYIEKRRRDKSRIAMKDFCYHNWQGADDEDIKNYWYAKYNAVPRTAISSTERSKNE